MKLQVCAILSCRMWTSECILQNRWNILTVLHKTWSFLLSSKNFTSGVGGGGGKIREMWLISWAKKTEGGIEEGNRI